MTKSTNEDRLFRAKEGLKIVEKKLEQLKASTSQSDTLNGEKYELKDQIIEYQRQWIALEGELREGRYFAKASEIFPNTAFEPKGMEDIQGMANKFMRSSTHADTVRRLYNDQLTLLVKAANESPELDIRSRITRDSSFSSRNTDQTHNANACIIETLDGHKGHQGCDSAQFGAWWALVYHWMIGGNEVDIDKLLRAINAEDETLSRDVNNGLYNALIAMAIGEVTGTRGMRSHERNILHVPDPHDKFYDSGCNWVIFPIQTREQMLDWDGEAYDLAIFVGEGRVSDEENGKKSANHQNVWNEKKSRHDEQGAEEQGAEEVLTRKLASSPEIQVCSVQDLTTVAKSLGEMGLALADLHTRVTGGPRILDLGETIRTKIVAGKQGRATNNHDDIVNGINDLCVRIENNGITVPGPPLENRFGEEGKHVLKVSIRETSPPDPIVVAAKGTNNFFRQRGMRLLTGCKPAVSDDSDYNSESDSSFATSNDLDNADAVPLMRSTPVTPYKNFVGAVVVVTPDLLKNGGDNESDSLSCSTWN